MTTLNRKSFIYIQHTHIPPLRTWKSSGWFGRLWPDLSIYNERKSIERWKSSSSPLSITASSSTHDFVFPLTNQTKTNLHLLNQKKKKRSVLFLQRKEQSRRKIQILTICAFMYKLLYSLVFPPYLEKESIPLFECTKIGRAQHVWKHGRTLFCLYYYQYSILGYS